MIHLDFRIRFRSTLTPVRSVAFRFVWLVLLVAAPALTAAPVVSSFSPLFGVPGTQVTVNGSGFSAATQVEFGEQIPAEFHVVSDNKLTAIVPANGLTAQISVIAPSGTGTSASTFYVSPRLESFNPPQGRDGATITIEGANFLDAGTWVVFGSITSQVVNVTSPTQLRAQVPTGATNSILHVYTGAGGATSVVEFIASPAPLITSFSPENGLPGQNVPVVIDGANFQMVTNVSFGGTNATFSVTADTQISTTIPANAKTGKIRIGTAYGEAFSTNNFIVGPTITEVDPPGGPVGYSPVIIRGNDFSGVTNVTFNGAPVHDGLPPAANNQINVTVPPGATTGKIRVGTTTGEGFSEMDFVVGPYPQSFTPLSGPAGTSVRIDGAGFSTGMRVFFGDKESPSVNSPAPNQMNAIVPAGATNAPISVVSATATNTTTKAFLVTAGEPVIESFEPNHGVRGTKVQLRGAGFNGTTSVTIGGIAASFDPPSDPTTLNIVVPAGARTGPIRVTNPSGTATTGDPFYASPVIEKFAPARAVVNTFVEITGTNFTDVSAVYFNGRRGEIITEDPDQLFVRVPADARTGPVQIDTPAGSFITATNFTVLPDIQSVSPLIGPVGTEVTITGTSFYNVTNVAFHGTSATFTAVSPSKIQTTVPTGATSGPIRVGTTDGESISAESFTVTVASDLTLTETVSTNIALPGQTLTYVSSISNHGASAVTGTTYTNRFASGSSVQSAVPSQGGCEINGLVVSCELGVIPAQTSASVTIQSTVGVSGVYTNFASVRAVEGDTSVNDNNTATVVVVAEEAQRTLKIRLLSAPDEYELSWKASPVPFRLQYRKEFGNPDVGWSNFLNGPFPASGTNHVTNSATFMERYFRLAY